MAINGYCYIMQKNSFKKIFMNSTQGFKVCAHIFHHYIKKYLVDGAFYLYQYWPYAKSTYFLIFYTWKSLKAEYT